MPFQAPTFLATEGNSVETGANKPFAIHDPNSVWLIDSGSLDVFGVRYQAGLPASSRIHLHRFGPGQAVFGLDDPSDAAGLLAVGLFGTRIRRIPIIRLIELSQYPAFAGAVSGLIEQWIAGLYHGLSTEYPPGRCTVLVPD